MKGLYQPISNDMQLVAMKNSDGERAMIDIYLEKGDFFEIIASVEDDKEMGLRIISYNDLADDEPGAIIPILNLKEVDLANEEEE